MERFFGREDELASMNLLWETGQFQLLILYGRRRVGKTTLIQRFINEKPAIFFTAQEANDSMNLSSFSKKVYSFFGVSPLAGSFNSWETAFDFLAEEAAKRPFILAFDEFPYAAGANKSLRSILQNVIDHKLKQTPIFIILCGSEISFMEREVLGYKSPLFGRRTAQIKLNGFDYYDSARFMQGFNAVEKLTLYSCIGGTPNYLAQINNKESVEENLKRLYFNISGYMYNEPMMLLQQELREPAFYNSIVSAIAGGACKLNEIATKINEEPNKVLKYLKTLIELHIVEKIFPFGEDIENSRKGIYTISDFSYLFWYRFVFPNKSEIESGYGYDVADSDVFGEELSQYIGKPPFETIARQYLVRMNKKDELPFKATSHGLWWGNDQKEKKQADFDVILANRKTKKIILGECKWRNSLNDCSEIMKLTNKQHLLPEYKDRYYYFFSKTEYTDAARALETDKIKLITAEQMFEI